MAPAKSPSIFNLFSASKEDEKDPYIGAIEFKKHTILFANGTMTILRHNITRVERYGVKRVFKISDLLYFISVAVVIITFLAGIAYHAVWIGTVFFGIFALVGFMERKRPKLSGLTIEMNSGATYNFLNKNTEAIRNLYNAVSEALELGFTLTATFQQGDIVIDKSIHTHFAKDAENVNIYGAESTLNTNR